MRNYECLYENLMSNNFRKTAVRKKKGLKLKLQNKGLYLKNWWGEGGGEGRVPVLKFLQRLALVSVIFPGTFSLTDRCIENSKKRF